MVQVQLFIRKCRTAIFDFFLHVSTLKKVETNAASNNTVIPSKHQGFGSSCPPSGRFWQLLS